MKVKTILVSQPEPKMENSPYLRLIEKEKVKVDFRPFIHVEGVDAKSVSQQKIDLKRLFALLSLPAEILWIIFSGLLKK